jgi:hypothetical protein
MSEISVKGTDRNFDDAWRGLRELGGSVWERDVVGLLARHGAEEVVLLGEYERLSRETSPPAVRYVSQLILDDERRHHRMLVEMANAVAWSLPGLAPEPTVPDLSRAEGCDEGFADAARALLAHERSDHEELKKLRKRMRPFAKTTLWKVLIDVMLLDTEKHIRLLGFLADHLDQG